MAEKKKKKGQIPVCSECLSSSEEREFFWIDSLDWNPYSMISHNILICNQCLVKLGIEEDKISRPWSKKKKKKAIDTKGWVTGEPTAKGNPRYVFITPEGTEKLLIAESGIKKGYSPKMTE